MLNHYAPGSRSGVRAAGDLNATAAALDKEAHIERRQPDHVQGIDETIARFRTDMAPLWLIACLWHGAARGGRPEAGSAHRCRAASNAQASGFQSPVYMDRIG